MGASLQNIASLANPPSTQSGSIPPSPSAQQSSGKMGPAGQALSMVKSMTGSPVPPTQQAGEIPMQQPGISGMPMQQAGLGGVGGISGMPMQQPGMGGLNPFSGVSSVNTFPAQTFPAQGQPQMAQPSGKNGAAGQISPQMGQPKMGQPNNYSNTIRPWDNSSMKREMQSRKGKGQ